MAFSNKQRSSITDTLHSHTRARNTVAKHGLLQMIYIPAFLMRAVKDIQRPNRKEECQTPESTEHDCVCEGALLDEVFSLLSVLELW